MKDEAVSKKALVFVRSCQNYMPPEACIYIPELDGGFHFIYGDPVRNKAGSFPPRMIGPRRGSIPTAARQPTAIAPCIASSIWSTTTAGKKPRRGLPPSSSRTHTRANTSRPTKAIARRSITTMPRRWPRRLSLAKVEKAGDKLWAETLAAELRRRQGKDGSWANLVELVREDEPLVATANAVIALAHCK